MFSNDYWNVASTGQPNNTPTSGGGVSIDTQVDNRIDLKAPTLTVDNANKLGNVVANDYAKKTDLPNVTPFQTAAQVNTAIDTKFTKTNVDALGIKAADSDRLGGTLAASYALKSEIPTITGGGGTTTVSGLTQSEVDARINTLATSLTVDNANKLGGSLATEYAKVINLPNVSSFQTAANVETTITNRATTLTVDNANKLGTVTASQYALKTDIPSVTSYQTADQVDTAITTRATNLTVDNANKLNNIAAANYLQISNASATYATKSDTRGFGVRPVYVPMVYNVGIGSLQVDNLYFINEHFNLHVTGDFNDSNNVTPDRWYMFYLTHRNGSRNFNISVYNTTPANVPYDGPSIIQTSDATGSLLIGLMVKSPTTGGNLGGGTIQPYNTYVVFCTVISTRATIATQGLTQTQVDARINALAASLTVDNANKLGGSVAADYAKKTDIPSVTSYQTADQVDTAITTRATTLTVDNANKLGTVTASQYALKTEIPNVTSFQTASQVDTAITTRATTLTVDNANKLGGSVADDYAKKTDVPTFRPFLNSTTSGITLTNTYKNRFVNHTGGGTLTFFVNHSIDALPQIPLADQIFWMAGEECEIFNNSNAPMPSWSSSGGMQLRVLTTGQTAIKPYGVVSIKCLGANSFLMVGQLQAPP